jgi:hypothetical protein
MTKIFISYRREDSQWPADKIYAAIKPRVADPKNDVFIDVDNIPLGVNFADHLDGRVAQCDVMLALIGRAWLDVKNPKTGARRIEDPEDFVRIEIASALKRGKRVVPVLLDGAQVPAAADLPADLKPLALCNGVEVRRLSFDADAANLFDRLGLSGKAKAQTTLALIAIALVAAGLGAWLWIANPGGWRTLKGPPPTSAQVNDAIMTLDAAKFAAFLKTDWDPNSPINTESNAALHGLMEVCEKNPTHDAAQLTRIAVMLIDGGANKQLQNKWGDTPLRIASSPRYCGPNHPVVAALR